MDTGTASCQIKSRDSDSGVLLDQTAATSAVIEQITLRYADLRHEARVINSKIVEGHHKAREGRLDDRTAVKARNSVLDLLSELAMDQGLTWSSIARLCRISLSAIRKWRYGEDPSPKSCLAVARLAAFIDLLVELPVKEPATWLAMSMVSDYTITAEDLYIAGYADQLLDFAAGQSDVYEILNEFDGNWRTLYRSHYEIVKAGDGHPSIVRRS